ncbi:hypothetical protein AB0O39_35720 [Streptomyces anulatus]|uniref:hypothetical protein n=1 Tax=Streptomyces anulatus TaxID=1892 RepID=UPI00341FB623
MVVLILTAGLAALIPFAVQAKRTAPAYDRTGLTASQKHMMNLLWLIADNRTWLGHASSSALHNTLQSMDRKCDQSQEAKLRTVQKIAGIGHIAGEERRRTLVVYEEFCGGPAR